MIDYWTLNNGARLVVEEIPYLKSAAIGVYIKLGSRHEPHHMSGASHFIEHMLFKGTGKRSAREIAESFEGIGGQLNAFTSKEYTCVYARTLDENMTEAIDIIFDMLFDSSMHLKDFNTEKGVVIEEINMYEDTPDDLIHDVFAQKMWQGHPMGYPILGTLETVTNFSRQEIYDFYRKYYTPGNMVVSVAGNVNREEIRDLIQGHLEKESYDEPGLQLTESPSCSPFVNLVEKDTEQVQICLGVPGISYHDPRRFTQNVMNSILGGGLSSRLFQKLREELGLAYSVYSYPASYSDTGCYSIYIGTGPQNISKFFQALFKEIEEFIDRGVSQQEVERTQRLIKSSMYMGLESVNNRMSRLGKSILMYGEIRPVEEVIEKILAVNTQMIQDFAAHILDKNKFSLAAIGPAGILPAVKEEYRKWWG